MEGLLTDEDLLPRFQHGETECRFNFGSLTPKVVAQHVIKLGDCVNGELGWGTTVMVGTEKRRLSDGGHCTRPHKVRRVVVVGDLPTHRWLRFFNLSASDIFGT